MIQQCVPLARRAISGDRLPLPRRFQEQLQQIPLDLQYRGGESGVTLNRVQAHGRLITQHACHRIGR